MSTVGFTNPLSIARVRSSSSSIFCCWYSFKFLTVHLKPQESCTSFPFSSALTFARYSRPFCIFAYTFLENKICEVSYFIQNKVLNCGEILKWPGEIFKWPEIRYNLNLKDNYHLKRSAEQVFVHPVSSMSISISS